MGMSGWLARRTRQLRPVRYGRAGQVEGCDDDITRDQRQPDPFQRLRVADPPDNASYAAAVQQG